jgi:hypothetical protein
MRLHCAIILLLTLIGPVHGFNKFLRRLQNQFKNAIMSTPTVHTVRLQHPGTCSGDVSVLVSVSKKQTEISFIFDWDIPLGMFWRGDPATKASPPTSDNWPRNGALLQGTGPVVVNGEKYFKVSAIQQAGTKEFVSVPEGTYMLYEQDGPVLHKYDA